MEENAEEKPCWVKWEKKFELGIPVIDEQHKHLVGLCNTLHNEIMQQRGRDGKVWQTSLSAALRETVNYTRTHFVAEEKLMSVSGFDQFSAHKKRHQDFIETITQTLSTFDQATLQTALDFSKFLYEWILEHIAYEDKLYVKPVLEYYRTSKQ
ncbi:bacteriohemerythrin [Treponema brennaborense]|uniref:Hemerythrin-like metal-binding protein n=1 Tax=Treponema brennaborense (strain DSM 12168 / CIP 105900 / DD5/3) TaxID=906968 RepID=F4LJ58_TREBD|nr:hemerythrin family protein [Treponema brennaborense]AEE16315.1 hemerythrin-like metal-binding protein [Treponema brennaborense DSM 12168]